MPRALWWSYGGEAVSYERGTLVGTLHALCFADITQVDTLGARGTKPSSLNNQLVRVHLIIELILVDRPCASGV